MWKREGSVSRGGLVPAKNGRSSSSSGHLLNLARRLQPAFSAPALSLAPPDMATILSAPLSQLMPAISRNRELNSVGVKFTVLAHLATAPTAFAALCGVSCVPAGSHGSASRMAATSISSVAFEGDGVMPDQSGARMISEDSPADTAS
jgi:hypothetical protein